MDFKLRKKEVNLHISKIDNEGESTIIIEDDEDGSVNFMHINKDELKLVRDYIDGLLCFV